MNRLKYILVAIAVILLNVTAYSQEIKKDIWYTTVLKENFFDKDGKPLTGKGVVIGDVDSGIDIFHPMFFFADGGEYSWIDVDKDGKFTPGVDVVDFNHDGIVNKDNVLEVLKIKNNTYNYVPSSKDFEADMDFLYIDKNHNGKRDFGEKDGFTESVPTYGEQLFIVIDENKNNKLDKGEKLVALKTSKVRAVREKDGTIRRRGIDLIKTEPDTVAHGTSVCGIILGGHSGVQRMHGFAPDAELVMANIKYEYTPRFVRTFPDMLKFIKDEKVNVLLFEDGEWSWEFMDGSTEEEEMADQMAREGITVIGGGGNLASGRMHLMDTIKAGTNVEYKFVASREAEGKKNDGVFVDFLWTNPDDNISFSIKTPDGAETKELSTGSEFFREGNFNIYYAREVSPKGTVMFKISLSRADSGAVNGKWSITVKPGSDEIIDGFIADVTQSWGGPSHWDSKKITDERTVTFPSTADSCLAIGAYTVNVEWPGYGAIDDLCSYSGRGLNITGKIGIDICAPGHTTFTTAVNNSYGIFSGTSSAAPHVVGTAALLLQYDPTLTHSDIRNILHASALTDKYTGDVPNTNWGWGKLNPEAAIKYLMSR
jgi:subtilisin family serine protease